MKTLAEDLKKVEQSIIYSSLFLRISLLKNTFIIKSVSAREIDFISLKMGYSLEDLQGFLLENNLEKVKRYTIEFILQNLIFLNGINCIEYRGNKDLYNKFEAIPIDILLLLFDNIQKLTYNQSLLLNHLDFYCETSSALYMYSLLLSCGLNDYRITGLYNSEKLPITNIQNLFMMNMSYRKEESLYKRFWEPFKLVIGMFDSKFINKFDSNISQIEIEKSKRRLESSGVADTFGGVMTKDDLVKQLKDMVSGKQDQYDLLVKAQERAAYETWKNDFMRKFKGANLTEEALLNLYIKQFKFSYWLMDEYKLTINNQ